MIRMPTVVAIGLTLVGLVVGTASSARAAGPAKAPAPAGTGAPVRGYRLRAEDE